MVGKAGVVYESEELASMYVCVPYVRLVPTEAQRGLGTEAIDICELSPVC